MPSKTLYTIPIFKVIEGTYEICYCCLHFRFMLAQLSLCLFGGWRRGGAAVGSVNAKNRYTAQSIVASTNIYTLNKCSQWCCEEGTSPCIILAIHNFQKIKHFEWCYHSAEQSASLENEFIGIKMSRGKFENCKNFFCWILSECFVRNDMAKGYFPCYLISFGK